MKAIKALQAKYKAGEITEAEYKRQLKARLDDGDISQKEHDEAAEFDPEEGDERLIYTQGDMDRAVLVKARQMIKKGLKEAGVELTDVQTKDLLPKMVELVKAGQGEGRQDSEVAKENAEFKKRIAQLEKSSGGNSEELKRLRVENAIFKTAGRSGLTPYNMAQVVRAITADYSDLLEYDEEDKLVAESVTRAVKRLAKAEPNLFQNADGDGDETDTGDDNEAGSQFKGKPPGGNGGDKGDKAKKKQEALKAEALAMLGITKEGQK